MTQQEAAHLQSQKAKELAQQATEQFQKELLEALQSTRFPAKSIPFTLHLEVQPAMRYESPSSLNCSLDTFNNIYHTEPNKWNMQEFEIAIAMLKTKNAYQLKCQVPEYITFQRTLDEMAKKWVELTQGIAKPIEERIETARKEQLDTYIAELRKKSVMDELQGNGTRKIPLGTA